MTEASDRAPDSTFVVACFNIFMGCTSVRNQRVTIPRGLEQLATVSARCFCRGFHFLTVRDPTSSVLVDIRRRYRETFPDKVDFTGLISHHTMIVTHASITGYWSPHHIWRDPGRPSDHEYTLLACNIAEAAQAEYQRERRVPDWILRFAFDSLSLDPLPPVSVIADCLRTIAVDLGCGVSNVATLGKRYISLNLISMRLLTNN